MNRLLSFPFAETLGLILLGGAALVTTSSLLAAPLAANDDSILKAFKDQSIQLTQSDIERIRNDIALATEARCVHGPTGDNSKAKFAAVEIASKLDLNTKTDASVMNRINSALKSLPCLVSRCGQPESRRCRPIEETLSWQQYFNDTLALNSSSEFLGLVNEKGFSPVKISWEDIGRYENSVWGDRISDVGIWV
ncbi:MAG: hypothetical protein J5J00_13870, partial [Deltaproteobacteria bacterium]|nr:hypothetical protein [Deltaproteobacteria bacterium]